VLIRREIFADNSRTKGDASVLLRMGVGSLEDRDMIKWDRQQQRVWVVGWRLHHGFTGIVLATLGGLLMAHDWKDRYDWIHVR
jgi:hypothetical protein